MNDVDKVIRLLKDPSIEKRIAAAIVLGELRAKQPQAIEGFVSLLESGVPVLQRHALEALTHVGAAKKVVAQAMELLGSNVEDVRRAATAAIRSVGEDVVPLIRARLAATDGAGAERRALDGIWPISGEKTRSPRSSRGSRRPRAQAPPEVAPRRRRRSPCGST